MNHSDSIELITTQEKLRFDFYFTFTEVVALCRVQVMLTSSKVSIDIKNRVCHICVSVDARARKLVSHQVQRE